MVKNDTPSYWHGALVAFGKMSVWIVGPILLALVVGKWLDSKFHTAPILFVSITGLSFVISMIGLVREGSKYMRVIENEANKSKSDERE